MFIEGVTKFSDLTPNEFRRTYLNLDINVLNTIHFEEAEPILHFGAEENFDWLDVLNPVKNQGSCGSCWAFSTVANLEGLYYIKYGEHKRFSEQMLVDCDTSDSACNGGLMEYTFEWIKSNGGLMLESDYAYTGKKGTCKSDSTKYAVKVTGYNKLSSDDENDILNYLVETGPLAIAVNADPLQNYISGIASYSKSTCDPSGINHAVNLVGYGVENGTKYWLVRNSWGADWGEDGYFRMLRGSGTCGINTYITSATIQ
jgi:cathepsin F